jgi:hypothetical protein
MNAQACQLCGDGPATRFVVRRHVGLVLMQKFYRVDVILCARHGREIASHFLNLTLVQGWWGVTSFFFNIAAVINDAMMLGRASRLAKTEPRIPAPPAPVSEPFPERTVTSPP